MKRTNFLKMLFSVVAVLSFVLSGVSALVPYTGQPQAPYLVFGHVEWNDQLLAGARLEVSNQNTGYSVIVGSNAEGYWQEDSGNWLTIDPNRPPVIFGDVIKVRALDGCGTGDVCEKSFPALSAGYTPSAEIDLFLTGKLVCPPSNCGSCSCGGGGGGGCNQERCDRLFPPKPCPGQVPCECNCPLNGCDDSYCSKELCGSLYPQDSLVCPPQKDCGVVEPCVNEGCSDEGFGWLAIMMGLVVGLVVGFVVGFAVKDGFV